MMRTEITGRGNWNNRNNTWLMILGRIKPEATVAQLETELTVVNKDQELQDRKTSANPRFVNEGRPVKLIPGSAGIFVAPESIVRTARTADGHRRRRSVDRMRERRKSAVSQSRLSSSRNRSRLAVGASRGRIITQLLTESVFLGILGGAAGLLFAYFGVQVLLNLMPQSGWVSLSLDVNPDIRMLLFTFAISFITGVVFGLAPAVQATRPAVLPALKDEKGATLSRSKFRLRKALVVAQVALSLLLLIGAGLFVRSLRNLKNLNAGFRPDNTLVADIDPAATATKVSVCAISMSVCVSELKRFLAYDRYPLRPSRPLAVRALTCL